MLEIGREDYQGFLAEIHDAWVKQCALINDMDSYGIFDSTISDLQKEFQEYIPTIKNGIAYFSCDKRIGGENWREGEIGIPQKIWWRFLYHPKTTFVTYKMIY